MYALSKVQYIKLVWKPRINIICHKDQTNSQKQLKLEVVAIFIKNCRGEIMNNKNRLKIYEEIMKCSFLENFEAFSWQLCYQPNYLTGVIPLFFVLFNLKNTYSANIFR